MNINGIKKFRLFHSRNLLQQKALSNKHTFEEEIYWDIDDYCLVINIIIGGEELGIVYYRKINEDGILFIEAEKAYKDMLKQYELCFVNIPNNL